MNKNNRVKTLVVPNFFIIENNHIDQYVDFLNKLMDKRVDTIFLDFSNVIYMRNMDYMMIIAQIEKAKKLNNTVFYRTGGTPKTEIVKRMLNEHVSAKHNDVPIPDDMKNAAKERLLIPNRVVDIANALTNIGIKERFFQFETFLTEIIGNATEHGIKQQNINWWATHSINHKKSTVKFVFVDMGVGIIGSHKKAGLPLKYIFRSKTKVPLDALYGKLRSSTKQDSRGRGLQQIRQFVEDGVVENFVLVTNCVSLRYENGGFAIKKHKNFEGTYFSWSISKETFSKWKTSQ